MNSGHGRGVATALMSLALLPLAPLSADAAGVPRPVSIDTFSVRGCPCTFVVTGAFEDAGTIVTDSVDARAFTSPMVGTATYVRTFVGQHGSLTIQLQSMITSTDDPSRFEESGSWVVLEASGAYAGLDGWGRESGIRDFAQQSLAATYDGFVH